MNSKDSKFITTIFSFGYKYGLPDHVNLLFDVRFLDNPFHVAELRSHNGTEQLISNFVLKNDSGRACLEQLQQVILFYIKELKLAGKDGLWVGIGCTGGHHRSVAVTEALAGKIAATHDNVNHFHRDITKESH